jgi:hypothetical protein
MINRFVRLAVATFFVGGLVSMAAPQDDAPPTSCKLKNSKCFRKVYPPNTEIPGCSAARDADCFGACYKPSSGSWYSSYCFGSFGDHCELILISQPITGYKTSCMSSLGKCKCNPDDYQQFNGNINVYRCKV